jgi:hypothetical protein
MLVNQFVAERHALRPIESNRLCRVWSPFLAAILICEPIRGSESFRCPFEAFSASAPDFRGQ